MIRIQGYDTDGCFCILVTDDRAVAESFIETLERWWYVRSAK